MSERHLLLYVEDNDNIAEVITPILTANGYDFLYAPTLADAETLAAQNHFCCAVVDLGIPFNRSLMRPRVEAGFALIEALRKRHPRRTANVIHELPIILYSAWVGHDEYDRLATRLGCDASKAKSCSPSEDAVESVIADALERSGRADHASCRAIWTKGR